MLVLHPASGLTLPDITRLGSWQARHIAPFELSRTRKFCESKSLACTCALWQVLHSTFPLMSFTAPNGSAVLPCATSDATRSTESFIGKAMLKGCEGCRFAPKTSCVYILPVVVTLPNTAVVPGATVPSWQL